jgi:phosphatidylglycerol:prolipoprotein diacylglycerol transferase
MRQVLFRIPLDLTVQIAGTEFSVFGFGLLLAFWVVLSAWWTFRHARQFGFDADLKGQLVFEAIVAVMIWKLPVLMPEIRIFGYGAAMVVGFLCASYLAGVRAKREGIDPGLIWDIGMAVLFSGVIGARMFWVLQNSGDVFKAGQPPQAILLRIINLPDGGLVLYGGVMLGIVAFLVKCWQLKLSVLRVADILISSIFVGEMFGRLGCFLNGCCYGDVAPGWSWPWAVQFPVESPAYKIEVFQGLIDASAQCSLPLLPAQIYSSVTALFLALLTWFYFPHRNKNGEVLLLGWLLYPIARFCLEIVRDEPRGFFGTPLTIAQEISIALFVSGLGFAYYLSTQPKLPRPMPTTSNANQKPAALVGNAAERTVSGTTNMKAT